ncbi:hypothetical protein G6F57_021272 [Rhizopus arrhizus]|nr:hypothetical protein G6F57_021272 [Rhizopus arrhizus]
MPQHQVAQLVGRQIGQDGLGGGATEHRERTAARIAGFDGVVRPVAVHAQHLVAVVAAQHQVGVKLVAGGAHHVAGGAHQRIVLAQVPVQFDDARPQHVGAAGGWGQQAAFGQRFQIPVGGGARALQMRHNVFLERGGGAVAKE